MKLRKNSAARMLRGGNYKDWGGALYLRCINRYVDLSGHRSEEIGFRFVIRGKP
jgi:hypothetical protein